MVAMEKKLKETAGPEGAWREQIRQRKENERQHIEQEAAQALASLESAYEEEKLPEKSTPFSAARLMWAEADRSRSEARAKVASNLAKDYEDWLEEQWRPQLESHREQLRAERAREERQRMEECHAEQLAVQREIDAMACEDAASSSFRSDVHSECLRRSSKLSRRRDSDFSNHELAITNIVSAKLSQLQHEKELEEFRIAQQESARREEAEQQEREYKDWKREVRRERYQRKQLEEHDHAKCRDAEQLRQLESNVADYFKEKDIENQIVLEDALQRASVDAQRLKQGALTPRSVLEEARRQATYEKKARDQLEPAKLEQELWDSLLAKNRRARQIERESKTPRWGIFTS